ncbi:MAG: hypothetical protein HY279_14565 [Nitrospinae bacterium]|nr:hypothetical protein [Nitrospinota bacterium]
MNLYYRSSYPDDPVELCKRVLSEDLEDFDKTKQDIFIFTIALNAEFIDGKKIENSLDESLKPEFIEVYNMAYLVLKVWKTFIKSILGKELKLPNLYLSLNDLKKYGEHHLYKFALGKNNIRRFEHKWRETVYHLSSWKMQSVI